MGDTWLQTDGGRIDGGAVGQTRIERDPLGLFFFSSRRRHTRWTGDWSSDVCSSDLRGRAGAVGAVGTVLVLVLVPSGSIGAAVGAAGQTGSGDAEQVEGLLGQPGSVFDLAQGPLDLLQRRYAGRRCGGDRGERVGGVPAGGGQVQRDRGADDGGHRSDAARVVVLVEAD